MPELWVPFLPFHLKNPWLPGRHAVFIRPHVGLPPQDRENEFRSREAAGRLQEAVPPLTKAEQRSAFCIDWPSTTPMFSPIHSLSCLLRLSLSPSVLLVFILIDGKRKQSPLLREVSGAGGQPPSRTGCDFAWSLDFRGQPNQPSSVRSPAD